MRIKKILKQELEKEVPNLSTQIILDINWEEVKENNKQAELNNVANGKEKHTHRVNFKVFAGVCCSLVLCLGIMIPTIILSGTQTPFTNQLDESYNVLLSVEPQKQITQMQSFRKEDTTKISETKIVPTTFEIDGGECSLLETGIEIQPLMESGACPQIKLEVSKENLITKQQGLNKDGMILLYKENLVNAPIKTGTQRVISKLNNLGCLGGVVKMCVRDSKGEANESKQKEFFATIKEITTVMNVTFDKFKELDKSSLEKIENDFENFEVDITRTQIETEFTNKLGDIIAMEKQDITILRDKIKAFRGNKDEDILIETDTSVEQANQIKVEIRDFIKKYKFDFNEEDLSELTYEGLADLEVSLEEDLQDLIEHEKDIKDWQNEGEENLKDMVEDLFDIVKEILFKD